MRLLCFVFFLHGRFGVFAVERKSQPQKHLFAQTPSPKDTDFTQRFIIFAKETKWRSEFLMKLIARMNNANSEMKGVELLNSSIRNGLHKIFGAQQKGAFTQFRWCNN